MQDHQENDSKPSKERPRASAPLVYPIEPPEPGGALQRIADGGVILITCGVFDAQSHERTLFHKPVIALDLPR